MANNKIRTSGTASSYSESAGSKDSTPALKGLMIGTVKNNIDPTHSGKLQVYIAASGGADPDDQNSWVDVEYMSPFLGTTSPGGDPKNGPDKTGDGKFVGNPQSYGFWASAPDIGTEVLCLFTDDDKHRGFYIGCIPKSGMMAMVPAIGSTSKVVPNSGEATTYGGADRLPTTEVNMGNPSVKKSATVYDEPKPVHSYQAGILSQQGLIRDNIRGVISSSAQRESPSRVFGISTPGSAIFEGGYDASTIAAAAAKGDKKKLQVQGRTGGHSFVMDDGTLEGADQLVRLRSSAGHQILMSDSGQTLFIIHSNGLSWIELGKEGTVDIYATNSFNVRTKGDLNLHADNDVNIHANKKLNMYGQSISIESEKDSTWRSGGNFSGYTVGNYTFKIDGSMGLQSAGEGGINSAGTLHLNGSKINMNSGTKGPVPATINKITKTSHIETTFSKNVGWMNPAPEPNMSITSRAPTHQPWIGSGKGVNVKINDVAPDASAPTATPATTAANNAAKQAPTAPTSAAEVAAAPAAKSAAGPLPATGVKALTAQVATTAQSLTTEAQKAAGVVSAASGLTVNQMEAAGAVPPGAAAQVTALVAKGMPVEKALDGKLTGVGGVTDAKVLVGDVVKQAGVLQDAIVNSATKLKEAGVLTGKESALQAAGPILAGVTHGVKDVADALKGTAGSVGALIDGAATSVGSSLGSLKDSLASGKLAAGLGESVSSGLGGLKASLEGLGDKLKSEADSMKSGLQNAFASVEKSFTALKGGTVNTLGNGDGSTPPPKGKTELAANDYDSAKAEYESAETEWFNAKRDYSYSKSDEDYERIAAAEKKMSSAKQTMAKASMAFLGSMPGGSAVADAAGSIKDKLGGITDSLSAKAGGLLDSLKSSTATSGLNALPGGAGALMASVSNSGAGGTSPLDAMKSVSAGANSLIAKVAPYSGALGLSSSVAQLQSAAGKFTALTAKADSLSNKITSASAKIDSLSGKASELSASLNDPTKLGGKLTEVGDKLKGAMEGGMSKLNGAADLAKSGASGIMAQLQTQLDAIGGAGAEVKSAVAATGTFDTTALKAKMGKLLGDAKIPMPSFNDSVKPSSDVVAVTEAQTAALEAVKDAQYKVNAAKLNASLTKTTASFMPAAQKEKMLADVQEKVQAALDKLDEAEKAYQATLNGGTTA